MSVCSLPRPRPRALGAAFLLVTCLARPPSAVAEEPDNAAAPGAGASAAIAPRSMTLDAAIAFARQRHPDLQAARARVSAARADAAVPRSQWLPKLGAVVELVGSTTNNSTATFVSNGAVDLPRIGATPIVGTADASLQPYPSTLLALGIRQTVFDFGRFSAEAAPLERLADAEDRRTDAAQLDVTFGVTQAHYAVLAARAVVKASDQALERSRAHRDQSKASVETGMRAPIELTRAEADVARFETLQLRAEGDLAIARGTLAAAVGVQETELDAAEAKPASAPPLPSLQSALARAEANEPLLQEATARAEAEKARGEAISAQLRPHLFATASISGRGGGATPTNGEASPLGGWVPEVPNWNVGLVLSWPIFDAGVLARSSASRAREEAARAALAATRQRVRIQTQQVYREVEVAEKALAALQRALDAANANYAQAEARFNAALGSSIELADAETLRTQAEIDLAIGKLKAARARAALERATVTGERGARKQ